LKNLIEEVVALPLATRRLLVASERSGDLENAFTQQDESLLTRVADLLVCRF
jgi:hypothetical protein